MTSPAQPPSVPRRASTALSRSRAWARPAGTGARIGAYTIDVFAVVVVSALVGVLTSSVLLGVLVALELAVITVVLEARTGITLGNLLLRMRTTRDDAPYSPGVARAAVRALVQGAGTLVALVGGWVVVATSAADPLRAGRSIADRAGRTLVVKVPTRAEREEWARSASTWAANAPQHISAPSQTPIPAPSQAPAHASAQAPARIPASAPVPPNPPRIPAPVPPNPPRLPAPGHAPPAAALPEGIVAIDDPVALPRPVRNVEIGEHLLLSFDTGQREQLPTPVTVNLGRKPVRTEGDDQLVTVQNSEGTVSKTHLRLEFRGGSVWLTDQGSTNGTEIFDESGEGAVLQPGVRVRLEEGSRVRVGNRSFTIATVLGEQAR